MPHDSGNEAKLSGHKAERHQGTKSIPKVAALARRPFQVLAFDTHNLVEREDGLIATTIPQFPNPTPSHHNGHKHL